MNHPSSHERNNAREHGEAADSAEQEISKLTSNWRAELHLTRMSSATAGGSERGKLCEVFHKIECARRAGQRLAAAPG